MRASPILGCLAAAALFGASTPVAKALLAELGPLSLAGALYLGAAVGVAPFCRRGGSAERRRQPGHRRHLAASVVFGGIAGPVLLLWGLSMTAAASASLWLNLETVATAVCAWLLFREHLGRRGWLAVGLIAAAGALLAAPFETGTVAGAALIALACVCWGIDNNATSLIDGYTPAQSTLVKGLCAGGVNLGLGIAVEGAPSANALVLAAALGSVAYGVSLMLYIRGAHHLGATRSQMLFASAPFWGLAIAWVGFGEPVLVAQVVAIVPFGLGVALLLNDVHAHEHVHAAQHHSHSHRHDDGHHDHLHPGLPPWVRHTHAHDHRPLVHAHAHLPDLHHRHDHEAQP